MLVLDGVIAGGQPRTVFKTRCSMISQQTVDNGSDLVFR